MKKLTPTLLMAFMFLLICASCSFYKKNESNLPPVRILDATIAKSIDFKGDLAFPVYPSQIFSPQDKEAVSHVEIENLTGYHEIKWEWIEPDGKIYISTDNYKLKVGRGKIIPKSSVWHEMFINGEKAAELSGMWKINIYLDDALVSSQEFEIQKDIVYGSPVGVPPILSIANINFSEIGIKSDETKNLEITVKNEGYGSGKDVYIELWSGTKGLIFDRKINLETIKEKNGVIQKSVSITGGPELGTGIGSIDLKIIDPNFKTKVKGKRIKFKTERFYRPELILAKFEVKESVSYSQDNMISKNEIIDLKITVQNIGPGSAEDIQLSVINKQEGLMFLGAGLESEITESIPIAKVIEPSKYEVFTFRYFLNNDFKNQEIKFSIKGTERNNKYGFSETKQVPLNKKLISEGAIKEIKVDDKNKSDVVMSYKTEILDLPDNEVDIDVNVAITPMNNPDAVAIIIGNQSYKQYSPNSSKFALKDAELVRHYVMKTLAYNASNIIYEIDVEKKKFEKIFGMHGDFASSRLYSYIKPKKSDVFIYYIGASLIDKESKKSYICPTDFDPKYTEQTGYSISALIDNIAEMEPKRIIMIFDTGFEVGNDSGISPFNEYFGNISKGIVLLSSSYGQISNDYEDKKHSLFTYFFLKAISGFSDVDGDRNLSFQEIFSYISNETEAIPYWARRLNKSQMPVMIGSKPGDILVVY
ncbi:MAG: hypothetical protein HQK76_10270 [Desulfobacterales bacterium]|nr:hypothetical protein [Desulfobacterales bacterium]